MMAVVVMVMMATINTHVGVGLDYQHRAKMNKFLGRNSVALNGANQSQHIASVQTLQQHMYNKH